MDALTTRRLAERLGVRPGALYRHFDSKRALLNAMVAVLINADTGPAPEDGDLVQLLRWIATGSRAAMLAHRDGARLVITYLVPEPGAGPGAAQQNWENLLAILRRTGISDHAALTVVDTLFAYVNGFTMEEQARDGFPQSPEQRSWRDQGFQAGLDLIMAGIQARAAEIPEAQRD